MDNQGLSLVIGASGGIGAALLERLQTVSAPDTVIGLSRSSTPGLDLLDEDSIAAAAAGIEALTRSRGLDLRRVIDATGLLHDGRLQPERGLKQLEADHLAKLFAVNAIGPALLMKHFLPVLPRRGRSIFATLSARVGSISDNRLGGWYGYRASKAALNQLVRTAAIELARRHPDAICIALHPGTVDTRLSAPFAKSGLKLRTPQTAALELMAVIDGLDPSDSGGFRDHNGIEIPY
ncbi:SDR family NAD(P)-dependent oxidoreductase [Maricaulis sp.]|uniref:SDR family NAD(P)-dependent oxidoreductase n=1 Tax=Maricaulis sp. TaxID=1486257 RepID=UPI003A943DF7